MRFLNKCDKCYKRVPSVRSKFVDGKILWLCYSCFDEIKNEDKKQKNNTTRKGL